MPNPTTISTNTTTSLGDSGGGTVTTKVITFTASTSPAFVGSCQVVMRQNSTLAWKPSPYVRRVIGAAASDQTVVSAAITGDAIISVDGSGVEIGIITTGISAGSMQVNWADLGG